MIRRFLHFLAHLLGQNDVEVTVWPGPDLTYFAMKRCLACGRVTPPERITPEEAERLRGLP